MVNAIARQCLAGWFGGAVILLSVPAMADELSLTGYQRSDGAITVAYQGELVDPYFACKALLVARQTGLAVTPAVNAWVDWGLRHQGDDGRFSRFCVRSDGYVPCADADADDASLAVWIELLVSMAPADRDSSRWRESLAAASAQLSTLYDKERGLYLVSQQLRVALLMDNVEVYSALSALAAHHASTGNKVQAQAMWRESKRLRQAILRQFWQPARQSYRVSSQHLTQSGFYPHQVGQLYPLLAGITPVGHKPDEIYRRWMRQNRASWFAQAEHDYPWGLVALAGFQLGEHVPVCDWLKQGPALRHGAHWNVLEEVLYQGFSQQLPVGRSGQPCRADTAKTHMEKSE